LSTISESKKKSGPGDVTEQVGVVVDAERLVAAGVGSVGPQVVVDLVFANEPPSQLTTVTLLLIRGDGLGG
jgi:hypothetical protein